MQHAVTHASLWTSSGTGNTLHVARWMATAAEVVGVPTRIERIDARCDPATIDTGPHSAVGVLMPTHGFTAPWIVLKTLAKFPNGHGAAAFCVATRGGLQLGRVFTPGLAGTACFVAALMLACKGYRVRGVLGIDMPSNWMSLHSALKPAKVEAIGARAQAVAERFAQGVLSGRFHWLTRNAAYDFAFGMALVPISLGYLVLGRAGLGKLFFATNACNACGLCEAACPVGAVKLRDGRPFWTWECESCMRCMSFCPRHAIDASQSLAVLLCLLMAIPVVPLLLGPGLPRWLLWPLETALWGLELAGVYRAVWWLQRSPRVRSVLSWTTATTWYRRHRQPDVRLKQLAGPFRLRGQARELARSAGRELAPIERPTLK
jgi:ferredoxin